jgi:hypothetical protein
MLSSFLLSDVGPLRPELGQRRAHAEKDRELLRMKHPSTRELFGYWNERRGSRAMPERADIEPAAIRRVLADTFILSFEPALGHPFRLAGTRVCALFGREVKAESFLHLFAYPARSEVRDLVAIVAQETIGVIANASELNGTGSAPSLELLLLPLGNEGRGTARLLGALAPMGPPHWLGTRVLGVLALGSYRFLNVEAASSPPQQLIAQKRTRPNLVVYDGGQR